MSVSLTTARRDLGRSLGPYGVFVASAGSTTTATITAAFLSSELPVDALASTWLYGPALTAPKQRRVTIGGLNGATGVLTLESALGSAIGSGTVVEISPRLPAIHESSATIGAAVSHSLHGCLNLTRRHVLVDQDDLAVPLVSGQRDYSLAGYPWLDRDERLVDVRVLDALGASYVSTSHRWEIRPAGKGSTLHFDQPFRFSSGSYAAHLVVKRPADSLIKIGGVWFDSQVDLTAETDEAPLELAQWIPGALAFAYRALRDRNQGAARATYHGLYVGQLQAFRRVHNYDATNDMDPSVPAAPPAVEAA